MSCRSRPRSPRAAWALLAALVAAVAAGACGRPDDDEAAGPRPTASSAPGPGAKPASDPAQRAAECGRCHPREAETWAASPHARHGTAVAEPPGGADAAVGSHWMQAYLRRDEGGVLRIVPVCWDIRDGRWRDVREVLEAISGTVIGTRGGERGALERRTFETDCSGCHASGTHLRMDTEALRLDGVWRDLAIDCEACHATGGRHGEGNSGAVARLQDLPPRGQTMVCGRCHGGPPTAGDLEPSEAVHFLTVLEDRPGHFRDGTPAGQSYQIASFVRSPCFLEGGLVCTDCHDAHGPDRREPASLDALCLSCHAGEAGRAHSHHDPAAPGGACVDCHMPQLLGGIMRHQRDHRIGVPLPMIPETPDACTACHQATDEEEDEAWSSAAWRRWWGEPPTETLEAAQAIAWARDASPEAEPALRRALRHRDPFFRAAAALYLREGRDLREDPVPEVRLAALRAEVRGARDPEVLKSFLQDAEPRIRAEATIALVATGAALVPPFLEDVRLLARQSRQAVGARRLLAAAALRGGRPGEALPYLEEALAADLADPPTWVDVAEVMLREGRVEAFRKAVGAAVDAAVEASAYGLGGDRLLEETAASAIERGLRTVGGEVLRQAADRWPDPAVRQRFFRMHQRLHGR